MYLGILLHHAESAHCLGLIGILKRNIRFLFSYTEIGPVLDVKVISPCNVCGIEIQIPSTSGDTTKGWVVMSRSSIRYVDELLVKYGISCRSAHCERRCREVSNEIASQFEDTSSKSVGKFLCFVRKAAANMN